MFFYANVIFNHIGSVSRSKALLIIFNIILFSDFREEYFLPSRSNSTIQEIERIITKINAVQHVMNVRTLDQNSTEEKFMVVLAVQVNKICSNEFSQALLDPYGADCRLIFFLPAWPYRNLALDEFIFNTFLGWNPKILFADLFVADRACLAELAVRSNPTATTSSFVS